MRKGIAIALLIAAMVMIVGGVFIGMTLGWDFSRVSADYEELLGVNASRVKEIRADMRSFDLRIYEAWDDELQVNGCGLAAKNLTVTLSEGVLTITEREISPLARRLHRDSYNDYALIWIPEDFAGSIALTSESGDLTLSSLVSPGTDAMLTSESGELSMYSSELASLRAVTTSGDVNVYDGTVGRLEITTDSGNVWLNDLRVQSADVFSDSGDIMGNITAEDGESALRIASETGYMSVNK